MTLSVREETGCTQVLEKLDYQVLKLLAKTVTGKKRTRSNKEGLINGIVKHSNSAKGLLERRKVNCASIFKYLEENGALPQERTKPSLVNKAIEYWNEPGNNAPRSPARRTGQVHGERLGNGSQGLGNNHQNLHTPPTQLFVGAMVPIPPGMEQQILSEVLGPRIQQHPPARN
ncbi:uncharacterized protein C3orf38-like [Pseudophryne corroboree]|uniref:uncharacterized protein C3orf38-like n=1 Tax=Pseudophryne corroboree TaxID=495146 RepID=UPI003081C730